MTAAAAIVLSVEPEAPQLSRSKRQRLLVQDAECTAGCCLRGKSSAPWKASFTRSVPQSTPHHMSGTSSGVGAAATVGAGGANQYKCYEGKINEAVEPPLPLQLLGPLLHSW